MSYIYGTVCHPENVDPEALAILRADLQRYPTDGHVELTESVVSGGLFYQNLRKPPFPSEAPLKDPKTGIIIFASTRLDYRSLLLKKLGLDQSQLSKLTDTQLILNAYLKWDEHCVHYLEGDFSFLIWNPSKQYLWGARDPMGFQPLFFSINGQTCFFSSHTTGLARIPGIDRSPDEVFFANRLLRAEGSLFVTPYKGINQIPVGHTIRIDSGKISVSKYHHWQIIPSSHKVSREDYTSELVTILSDAIETRLYADYPVGGFLSGGLDSSSVMAILQSLLQQGSGKSLITTSSVHPKGTSFRNEDERPWVDIFKKHFPETEINYCTLEHIPPLRQEDAEFFSTVRLRRYPTTFITEIMEGKLISEGCRTFFTGWRGDHFISRRGYAHYIDFLKQGRFFQLFCAIRDTAAFTNRSPKALFKAIIKENVYANHFGVRNRSDRNLLNKEWVEGVLTNKKSQSRRWKLYDTTHDFSWFLPDGQASQQFYEDTSFNSKQVLKRMIPLSDPRIINFTLQLPAEEFSKGGMDRSIMRRAMKNYLPDELRLRNTKGSFMGNESAISAKIHEQWLEQINISSLIDQSPLRAFINPSEVKRHIAEHKKNIKTGNVDLQHQNTYLLNMLGFLFFFDGKR
ncbi:asparagine synthetase B family protein [Roseivirga sp. E12]|uniref:asparagine synthase-related protein n=1 Tax=Roseivirga sp. E12 TaxID=2819237 RepID=UPI001ABC5903|nr:asparagine synthetase B family protein [Roseivirga sp. E12]MBO3699058.1 hypothetical protein [Roseivirga sp. E12]